MILIHTQTNIAVLQHLSLGNILQSVNFLLSKEESKDLFDHFETKKYIIIPEYIINQTRPIS